MKQILCLVFSVLVTWLFCAGVFAKPCFELAERASPTKKTSIKRPEITRSQRISLRIRLSNHINAIVQEEAILEALLKSENEKSEEIAALGEELGKVRQGSGRWSKRFIRESWGPEEASSEETRLETSINVLENEIAKIQDKIDSQRAKIGRREDWIANIRQQLGISL